MTSLKSVVALCAFAVAATTAAGPVAAPRDALFVSTAWLAQHLKDPNLVLIHIGDEAEFKTAHIPGARFVDYDPGLARRDEDRNLSLEMLPADVLHDRLAAIGISDNSRIIVYFAKNWVSPATRVMLTLDYAGLGDKASLLDGGLGAWTRDGHEVTAAETPAAKPGTLAPLKIKPEIVDAAFVQAHLKTPGFAIVDGRATVFYDGVQRGAKNDGVEKFGHVPGAHSVPFTEVTDDQLMWKSADDLTALFAKAGVKPGDTVVGYCHIGQQATAMLFAARSLGHPVLLYDGSFQDWAAQDKPLEKTPGAVEVHESPRAAILMPVAVVAQRIADPTLVILHVGDKAAYDKGHIPGARFVILDDISVSDHEYKGNGLMLEMPAVEDLRMRLSKLGISNTSRILVYSGSASITSATRVMLTLDYAGLGPNSVLLDGGLSAWIAAGQKVTAEVPPEKTGNLTPLRTKPIVVDAKFVFDHLNTPGFAVVDGRAKAFYDGVQTGDSMGHKHKTGHIAGARNVPFTEITTDQVMLKPAAELEALFTNAGIKPGDTVIGYCHIGQQATAMLFAARSLGHPVILYDGSFEDWSLHTDYPVEKTGGIK